MSGQLLSKIFCPWCCQGGLDMQYLASRFEKGKEATAAYMANRRVFVPNKQLTLAQGSIVEKQASLGKSTFLDRKHCYTRCGRL